MSKSRWQFEDLASLAADPNVTAPPDGVQMDLPRNPTGSDGLWIACRGGAPTIELWAKVDKDTWLPISSTFGGGPGSFTPSADALDVFPVSAVPMASELYLRVTAINGCTRIDIGTLFS